MILKYSLIVNFLKMILAKFNSIILAHNPIFFYKNLLAFYTFDYE